MKKLRRRGKRELRNNGGKYDTNVTYKEEELAELVKYMSWKDPLKTMRKSPKLSECYADLSNETPVLPNWSYVSRRNVWVSSFKGVSLVVSPDFSGGEWSLYLEGETRLGSGEKGAMMDLGSKYMIEQWLEKEKQKEETK